MKLSALADAALDRSVALGYTRIGAHLRRLWWPDDPDRQSLAGKCVLVTGASSGIGMAMARSFAELGATVHVLGRSADKVRATVGQIRGEVPGSALVEEVCDVYDLDAVRAWTDDLAARVPALHGLVHNAGAMPPERAETAQGHEVQFATHVLGPHLITERLLPLLGAADGSSVVWVSSGGYLPLFRTVTRPLLRDPRDGADTAVWLIATRPESTAGHFWHDRAQRPTTLGRHRDDDPGRVAHFLAQVSAMTGTSGWAGVRSRPPANA